MGAAAELFVRVTADVKGLTAGMEDAADAVDRMGKEATQAAKPISSLRDIIAGTAVGELLADGIRSAAQAMVGLGAQAIKLSGELEQNRVAFTTMLGSAEKADGFLRDLAQFAANTPFELRGLTDSSKRLLAFGFDAQAILPIMNSVGNAVAAVGGGKETIDGVTMALGQMAAKGKVSAEEMNQLAERGIPAWKMLADGIGVSIPEAMKRAEKGSIDAGTAITALVNGMNTKFPGMMAKQSQTIMGALSNLQDSADAALTRIGERLIKTFDLTRVVQGLSAAVSNLTAAFTSGGLLAVMDRAFGPTTKAAILGIGVAVTASLIPSLTAAAASLAAMATAAAPFVALAGAIAFAAYPIIKNWDAIKGTVVALWDTAAQYTAAYYNRAVTVASNLAELFRTAFTYIGDAIRSVLGDELTNKLLGGIGRAVGAFKGFATMAVSPLRAVASVGAAAAGNFAETWRGAMSMSQGFTSDLFRQAGAVTRDFSRTLTADMLGIGKAAAAAAGGATKAASATAKHAAEARKAAAELHKMEQAGVKAFDRFEAMAQSLEKVGRGLREVDAEAKKQGRSFDVAGAKLKVYQDGLGGVEKAFGLMSPQAVALRVAMAGVQAQVDAGSGALASARGVIDSAAKDLDNARQAAKVLGEEWNEQEQALKSAEGAMRGLIDQGLRPGNAAYDEQIAKLITIKQAYQDSLPLVERFGAASKDLGSGVQSLASGLGQLADTLGIQAAGPILDFIGKMGGVLMALDGIAKAIPAIIGALKTMGTIIAGIAAAIVALPVKVLIAGAVAIGLAVAVISGNWDTVKGKMSELWAWMSTTQEQKQEALRQEAERVLDIADAYAQVSANLASSDAEQRRSIATLNEMSAATAGTINNLRAAVTEGLKESIAAFTAGASNYGEILREKLRVSLGQAIIDNLVAKTVTAQFDQYFSQIADNIRNGMDTANAALVQEMLTKLDQTTEGLGRVAGKMMQGIGAISPGAASLLSQAQQEANKLREQHAVSLDRIYNKLSGSGLTDKQREVLLAQARVMQGRASEEDIRLSRGMATGGLVTGPTIARMGEGGRNEAVLPLNDNVYRQIGEGIAAARGGASGMQVVVNYNGNGKWTREDAQGLGRLLVAELRSMGVRA